MEDLRIFFVTFINAIPQRNLSGVIMEPVNLRMRHICPTAALFMPRHSRKKPLVEKAEHKQKENIIEGQLFKDECKDKLGVDVTALKRVVMAQYTFHICMWCVQEKDKLLASLVALAAAKPGFHGGGGGFGGGFGGGHGGGGGDSFGSSGFGGSYSSPQLDSYAAPISGSTGGGPAYGAPSQPPVIHKHVYVHVPPPEPTYSAPKKPIHVPPPQKHYKIVFIKAPTPPTPTVPEIALPAPDEQKTLIYVLVKKPEEQPEINIPTPAPTKPSKPEVYFIRYKTQQKDAYGPPAPPPREEYGAPSVPSAPSAPPQSSYGAPSGGHY
ncbi:WAS/WASL-interacting protein family member 3 [Hetaerina americana]|uniref:WAS/WASL-interacting protein family member 3 n=1 Tax=Hetaerina americana TaxID=62018 RepID=UPI003A7F3097